MAKETVKIANKTTLQAMVSEMEKRYAKASDIKEYSITKKEPATEGYVASYQLAKDGTPFGEVINIPKDYLVKKAELKESSGENDPTEGYSEGDKYIDFVINAKDEDGTESHIYLAVKDLVDPYTAGNGIDITKNSVTVKLDGTKSNGLSVTTSGLALETATTSTPGAMSAEDKKKLDETAEKAAATDTKVSGIDTKVTALEGQVEEIETQMEDVLTNTDFQEITEEEVQALWSA